MGQFESVMKESLGSSDEFSEELFTDDMIDFVIENKERKDLMDEKLIKYCLERKKGKRPPFPEVDKERQRAFVTVYTLFQRMKLISQ